MTDTQDPNYDSELDEALANAEAGLDSGPADDLGPLDAMIAERDQWKDRAMRAAACSCAVKR